MQLCKSTNPIESYFGKALKILPKLLKDGRIPLSTSQLMIYQMSESAKFPEWKAGFDTSDLIAYGTKDSGKIKVILTVDKYSSITENGKKALELINPNSDIIGKYNHRQSFPGDRLGINLQGIYNSLEGIEMSFEELIKYNGDFSLLEESTNISFGRGVLENKLWRILSRHPDEVPKEFAEDPNLLKEYANWVANQNETHTNVLMGSDSPKELGETQRLFQTLICGGHYRSQTRIGLDTKSRFVGALPNAKHPKLENIISKTK